MNSSARYLRSLATTTWKLMTGWFSRRTHGALLLIPVGRTLRHEHSRIGRNQLVRIGEHGAPIKWKRTPFYRNPSPMVLT